MQPVNYVRVSLIALVTVAMATLLVIADAVNHVAYELPQQVMETRKELSAQITFTRGEVLSQVSVTREQLLRLTDKHLTQIEADLNYKLDQTQIDLNTRLNDTNKVINNALYEYDQTALIAIASTLAQTKPIMDNAAEVLYKFNAQEPLVYSRYLATTGEMNRTLDATRRMAETFAKATPEIAENVAVTSSNVAAITTDVARWTKPESLAKTLLFAPLRMFHVNIGGK